MFGLKGPADEGGLKPLVSSCKVRKALEMFDAFFERLDMAEHHGGRADSAQFMPGAVTLSRSSVMTLPRVISPRTRSTRISAPPPGKLPKPACFSRSSTSRNERWLSLVK